MERRGQRHALERCENIDQERKGVVAGGVAAASRPLPKPVQDPVCKQARRHNTEECGLEHLGNEDVVFVRAHAWQ